MNIRTQLLPNETIVVVQGRLDAFAAPKLEQALLGLNGNVQIDLGSVEFIDDSGIQILIRTANNPAIHLQIGAVSDVVRLIFEITGVEKILPFAQNENTHHAHAKNPQRHQKNHEIV